MAHESWIIQSLHVEDHGSYLTSHIMFQRQAEMESEMRAQLQQERVHERDRHEKIIQDKEAFIQSQVTG